MKVSNKINSIIIIILVINLFSYSSITISGESVLNIKEDDATEVYSHCQPRSDYQVDVNMNVIDVIVKDKDGNHVKDLKPEDFELFEDGVRQKIARIDTMNYLLIDEQKGEPIEQVKSSDIKKYERTDTLTERHFAFLVANLPNQEQDKTEIMDTVKKFVENRISDSDQVALYHMTQNNIQEIVGFNNNKKEFITSFLAYLNTDLFKKDTFGYVNPFISGKESGSLDSQFAASTENQKIVLKPDGWMSYSDVIEKQRKTQQNDTFLRVMANTKILASYMKHIFGRKNIILLTSGLYNWPESRVSYDLNTNKRTEVETIRGSIVKAVSELNDMFNSYNISLYVLDVGKSFNVDAQMNLIEVESFGDMKTNLEEARIGVLQSTAGKTGGDFFLHASANSDKLDDNLNKIEYETSFYYNLSYYPSEKREPGTTSPIDVKVKRDNVDVKFRQSVATPKSYLQLTRSEKDQYLYEAITTRIPRTELSLCGDVRIFHSNVNASIALFSLEVPVKEVIHDLYNTPYSKLFFSVLVFTEHDQLFKEINKMVDIELKKEYRLDEKEKIRYSQFIMLPKGEYKVRFLVSDIENGNIVNDEITMKIPDFGNSAHGISSILPLDSLDKILAITPYAPLPGQMSDVELNKNIPIYIKDKLAVHTIASRGLLTELTQYFIYVQGLSVDQIKDKAIHWSAIRVNNKGQDDITYEDISYKIEDIIDHNDGNIGILLKLDFSGFIPGEYQLTASFQDKDGKIYKSRINIELISKFQEDIPSLVAGN